MAQQFRYSTDTSANGSAAVVLIIGIDPGTTGTKVAFLRAVETHNDGKIELVVNPHDKVHVLANFPGYRQSCVTTLPTCLVYKESGDLAYWGHEAVNIQAKMSFDPKFLIENWKIKLLEGSMQNPLGKPPQEFTSDFFHALFNHLFYGKRSALLGHFSGNDKMAQFDFIDIAVAMPPGWGHKEHTLFTDAAKKSLQGIPKTRISMVSETECALRSWQFQEGKYGKLKDGEVVILMDLGGGTACLSSFLYEGEQWVHLESYSLRAGSEVATSSFQRDFTTRLKLARIKETNKIFHRALKQFTERKMEIGTDDEEDIWLCSVEGLKHSEQYAFRDGEMLFTREQLRSYFQPLQEEILEKLDTMVARAGPKYCVLVGAYSRNDLFLKLLEKENERHAMKIVTPENQPEVVASGACYTRIEGDIRLVDKSKISVGIVTFKLWNDVKVENPDAYHFRLPGDNRSWYCRAITWVIKKGDRADPNIAIIDHDGNDLRRRYLQSNKDLIINEVVLTVEADPGRDETYTVLKYGTDDAGWEKNKREFGERFGESLHLRSFELDLTHMPVEKEDGSKVSMRQANFKCDTIGRYFEYKYYLNLSQTDCRISLQVFSRTGQTGKMLLQYSISAYEAESKELQDEQRFAEQLLMTQDTGKLMKKHHARCPAINPKRKSGRVKSKSHNGLPSSSNSRGMNGYEESLPEEEVSIITAAAENIQHRQLSNTPSPVLSNGQAVALAGELLQNDLLDPDINLAYSENENWNIAKDALQWLDARPNTHRGSPSASRDYVTLTPRLTTLFARSGASNLTCLRPSPSHLRNDGILEDIDYPLEDENDLDYNPRRKYHKKRSTPSSNQPGRKSKKTRTK